MIKIEDNFNNLYHLENIEINDSNNNFVSMDGVLFSKDMKTLIRYPLAKAGEYCIPVGVENIEIDAFKSCRADKIILPNTIVEIGKDAFSYCENIISLVLPVNLEIINDSAFMYAKNLQSIFLPGDNISYIGENAFSGIENLCFYTNQNYIEYYTDINDNFIVKSNSNVIDDYEIELIENYYKINKIISDEKEIIIPSEINNILVKEIGSYAFSNKVQKIVLPSTVESLDNYCFCSNEESNLTTIIFSENSNINYIGRNAFQNCNKLSSIILYNNNPYVNGYSTLDELKKRLFVYVNNQNEYEDSYFYQCNMRETETLTNDMNFAYQTNDSGIKLLQYLGCENQIILPDKINEKDVVEIGSFFINPNVEKIELPQNLKKIDSLAFSSSIYCDEFLNMEMGLKEILINEDCEYIGENAFYASNIEEIILPKKLENISPIAFENCIYLKNIYVDNENINFSSKNGVLYNYDRSKIIIYPLGKEEKYYKIDENTLIVGEKSFKNNRNLVEIVLPDNASIIEKFAFQGCAKLLNMDFPQGLISIFENAFDGCKKINSLFLPDSLKNFSPSSIINCDSLTSIKVLNENENLQDIDGILYSKDMTSLIAYPSGKFGEYSLPNTISTIYPYAFYGSKLTSIVVGSCVQEIGEFAFACSKELTSIIFENSMTFLPAGILKNCENLVHVVLPSNIEKLPDLFMENCFEIRNINLAENINYIGNSAFRNCIHLEEITLENNLLYLGDMAFENCKSISNLELPSHIEFLGENVFVNDINIFEMKIGTKYTLKEYFGNQMSGIPATLKNISIESASNTIIENMFFNCRSIEHVTICNSIDIIEKNAFFGCENLLSVEKKGVKNIITIGEKAFWNCKSLLSFKIYCEVPAQIDYTSFLCEENCSITSLPLLKIYVQNQYLLSYRENWKGLDISGF